MAPPRSVRAFAGVAVTLAVAALGLCACALTPGRVASITQNREAEPLVVQTSAGFVQGAMTPQGQAFLGIPFAAPPTGPLRFAPPAPTPPWTQVRDATRPGDICVQAAIPGAGRQSEDCLNLNVYAPATAGPNAPAKAVMVWFYGGGFAIGDNLNYDPSRLARREDVIVVAPNYRLGAFGFLAHPALKGSGEGAYALQDQQAALRWVQANIAQFGGDPRRVTVFGESAGAWSVCYHLASPAAKGLFQRAILQSGACASPFSVVDAAPAEAGGLQMAADLGCADPATAAACLRALPAERIRKAKPHRRGILGIDSWAPMVGGDVLPERPSTTFAAGRFPDIPIMDGTNHDEGRLFLDANRLKGLLWSRASYEKILTDFFGPETTPKVIAEYAGDYAQNGMGVAYADLLTDSTFACPALALNALLRPHASVYAYEFDDPEAVFSPPRTPSVPPLGSYHSSELAYVFGTKWAIADPAKFTPAQRALSDRMQDYWGALASKGFPNSEALPSWPLDDGRDPVKLSPDGGGGRATDFAARHHCAFWTGALG